MQQKFICSTHERQAVSSPSSVHEYGELGTWRSPTRCRGSPSPNSPSAASGRSGPIHSSFQIVSWRSTCRPTRSSTLSEENTSERSTCNWEHGEEITPFLWQHATSQGSPVTTGCDGVTAAQHRQAGTFYLLATSGWQWKDQHNVQERRSTIDVLWKRTLH